MNILVIGDTHGNTSAICNVAIPTARKRDCKLIIQVGDFGYWEHQEAGKKFLNKVSKALVRENMVMYWIDGNHENHPLLWQSYHPSGPYGLMMIRPNLYYVPRGTVFKIEDVTCLGLGGAFSIDRDWRINEELYAGKPETLWWPTEMITFEQAKLARENARDLGPIDLMFTHDCPTGTDIPGIHSKDKWIYPETWLNRDLLREVFDDVQPKMLIHGHYHVRYTDKLPLKPKVGDGDLLEWDYCRVDGLSNDGRDGFAVVLDMDALFV
jgi:Icc-related predicted phosphoesterase